MARNSAAPQTVKVSLTERERIILIVALGIADANTDLPVYAMQVVVARIRRFLGRDLRARKGPAPTRREMTALVRKLKGTR